MFEWLGDILGGIGDFVGDLFGGVTSSITTAIFDMMLQWMYNAVYGAVAEFFGMMGNMGSDMFDLAWVKATDPYRSFHPPGHNSGFLGSWLQIRQN